MNLLFFKEQSLYQLKANIADNSQKYLCPAEWMTDYFRNSSWNIPTNLTVDSEPKLILPASAREHYDYENTVLLFSALKNLTPSQAADERLWSFLTHFTFWDYMRNRWPAEKQIGKPGFVNVIRERYFFVSAKRFVRNGISRLWWYGYLTYDDGRKNPFELTQLMLSKLDIAQNLFERNFASNRKITKAVLSVLADREKMGKPFPNREAFRKLMKHFNNIGGLTVLDALDNSEVEKIVVSRLEKAVS